MSKWVLATWLSVLAVGAAPASAQQPGCIGQTDAAAVEQKPGAEKLRFGMVGVNDINPTAAAAPFGGVKESGLGREGGTQGLDDYLETKLIGLSVS